MFYTISNKIILKKWMDFEKWKDQFFEKKTSTRNKMERPILQGIKCVR